MASALGSVVPIIGLSLLDRGIPLFSAVFIEVLLGNMSTGLVFAILVTIVIPGLRGTATAIMLTVIHLFGDGLSQPLIGQISSNLQSGADFLGLRGRYSLFDHFAVHSISVWRWRASQPRPCWSPQVSTFSRYLGKSGPVILPREPITIVR